MAITRTRPSLVAGDDWWGELDAAVLDCLARCGAASPEEIGRVVGLSPNAVASVLVMLMREGKVRITRVEATAAGEVAAA
jgi:winged helix-turn-helix DNA-binding protein